MLCARDDAENKKQKNTFFRLSFGDGSREKNGKQSDSINNAPLSADGLGIPQSSPPPAVSFATTTTTTATTTHTATVTVPPPLRSAEPSFADPDLLAAVILARSNAVRAYHGAAALRWNATLAAFSLAHVWSSSATDADSCAMARAEGPPYGEILALGCGGAAACVALWAAEAARYDYAAPGSAPADTGHFSQLVWAASTDVGCAARLCPRQRAWYLACHYWPPGNVLGAFAEQVGTPLLAVAAGTPRASGGGAAGVVAVVVVAVAVVVWGAVV
ncbi:CAP domain-containing protein [Durotheca rogersii]|uniref:CAP domain-containing protein n=1 Tax=Durotheca rogersii TaxID=419775 RepID=UPI00221E80CD|nr:CAP domain-containing protein [Durotheca rogersii]KAI5865778.1 CAP domain-containing protein [Durotheca rogersii]